MQLLHISDIHFRDTEIDRPDDPNQGLRSDLVEDVEMMRKRLGAADAILVSGDIAYGGNVAEYNFAYRWFEEKLCPAAGCDMEALFYMSGQS